MAENKNSVLLYCDIIHTVEGLKDVEAGKLFKHYLRYINDLKPTPPDRLTELLFEPIKQDLKRDLKKYKSTCEKNAENAKKRWDKKNATASDRIIRNAKHADIDNDNDNDNDIDNKKDCIRENVFLHRKEIEKLKTQFSDEDLNWMYDKLSAYKKSKGKVYKSDYGAILNWVVDRLKEEKQKEKSSAKKENGKSTSKGEQAVESATNIAERRGWIKPNNT